MARVLPRCIRTPAKPVPPGYVPPGGIPYPVHDRESWVSIAHAFGEDPWQLIRYNFPTLPADRALAALEVNWYLQERVGCNAVTEDGKNYRFSSSAKPGIIYLPPGAMSSLFYPVGGMSQGKGSTCWYACLAMMVDYYRARGRGHGLVHPSEDAETETMYRNDSLLPWGDSERIARKLGFAVESVSVTPAGLWHLLRNGPVIYAGQWAGGVNGHWVIINGISGQTISVVDPAYGPLSLDYEGLTSRLRQRGDTPFVTAR